MLASFALAIVTHLVALLPFYTSTYVAQAVPPQRYVAAVIPSPVATSTPPSVATAHAMVATSTVPRVPFYSQFRDITSPKWQKVGCGITDLGMIVNYYRPGAVTVETLLSKGIAAGAYDYNAGWIYAGLIKLSRAYGLDGQYYNLAGLSDAAALAKFKNYLESGPVILSVHYTFNPKSTIPHLVVINGIRGDTVYYNDPATTGPKHISLDTFLAGWTKHVIVIRPADLAFTQ